MLEWFFYDLPMGFLIPILLLMLLIAAEVGFRVGHRNRARFGDPARSQIDTVQAALLGLLGLLMGFTYSMASERYESRKLLVVQEVNAIGTALLRAQLLPAGPRKASEDLLRRYIDARIASAKAVDPDHDEADAEVGRLQVKLWALAAAQADDTERGDMTALHVEALNEVIDSKTQRDAALADHVPLSVLALVFFSSTIIFGVVGYGFGLAENRGLLAMALLAALVALVFLVVIDLDRPREGLIRVGQRGLVRLLATLKPASP